MADSGIQSTQDKYARVEKSNDSAEIEANEVRITTRGRVKKYVDYAARLLKGETIEVETRNVSEEKKEASNSKDETTNENEEKDKDNNNNENNDGNGDNNEADKEKTVVKNKKFNSIVLKATGKAINKAVTTAEVVKRTVGDLHQVTSLETLEIVDVWEPKEEGLQKVETTRRVASITIVLSKDDSDIDKNDPGYQKPIPAETFAPRNYGGNRGRYNNRFNNRYNRGRGRGRGMRGGPGPRRGMGGPRGGPNRPMNRPSNRPFNQNFNNYNRPRYNQQRQQGSPMNRGPGGYRGGGQRYPRNDGRRGGGVRGGFRRGRGRY